MSQVRQNFDEECEVSLNKQINMELYASYVYLSMGYYFDRDDVALKGLRDYFRKASEEEREHAQKIMRYINKRGGRIILTPIQAPDKNEWGKPDEAMRAALELEKTVNESLLGIHRIATQKEDANLCDFLETEFLQEQVDSIKELADHLAQLKLVGDGLGIFIFDQSLKEK